MEVPGPLHRGGGEETSKTEEEPWYEVCRTRPSRGLPRQKKKTETTKYTRHDRWTLCPVVDEQSVLSRMERRVRVEGRRSLSGKGRGPLGRRSGIGVVNPVT